MGLNLLMGNSIIISYKDIHFYKKFISSHGTFCKSIIFYADAKYLYDNKNVFASVIELYYSLFHLGITVYLLHHEGTDEAKYLTKMIKKFGLLSEDDISRVLSHGKVIKFLIQKKDFKKMAGLLKELKEMRELVNYGPRTKFLKNKILWNYCEVKEKAEKLKDYFFKVNECYRIFKKYVFIKRNKRPEDKILPLWLPLFKERKKAYFDDYIGDILDKKVLFYINELLFSLSIIQNEPM